MNMIAERLKSTLRGTWIHHAVWAYRNPSRKARRGNGDKQAALSDRNANYNWQTVEVMFRVLHRDSNCIDVGAHAGDILRRMSDLSPRGRHYAFEPLPHLSRQLGESFPQAIVHRAAVSDKSGESE